MPFRCKLGFHDRRRRCACARCGAPAPEERFLDLTDWSEAELTDEAIRRAVQSRLARHQWNGCTCTRCGMDHAWILARKEQLDQRHSTVPFGGEGDGLYRRASVCAICGKQRTEDEWEKNAIG